MRMGISAVLLRLRILPCVCAAGVCQVRAVACRSSSSRRDMMLSTAGMLALQLLPGRYIPGRWGRGVGFSHAPLCAWLQEHEQEAVALSKPCIVPVDGPACGVRHTACLHVQQAARGCCGLSYRL